MSSALFWPLLGSNTCTHHILYVHEQCLHQLSLTRSNQSNWCHSIRQACYVPIAKVNLWW